MKPINYSSYHYGRKTPSPRCPSPVLTDEEKAQRAAECKEIMGRKKTDSQIEAEKEYFRKCNEERRLIRNEAARERRQAAKLKK